MHEQEKIYFSIILIVAIAAIAFMFYILSQKTDDSGMAYNIDETSCKNNVYYVCVKCCEDKANTIAGKDNYGTPDWSSAYNNCWKEDCK